MSISSMDLGGIVVAPTLNYLNIYTLFLQNLLLGTAAVETKMGKYLKQIGKGPALGIYQTEPNTEADVLANYVEYRPDLKSKILSLKWNDSCKISQLSANLPYSTAIAALCYFRHNKDIDFKHDLNDVAYLAHLWKTYYNTPLGAGEEKDFISAYSRYVF